jgi:hypothetical protein
MRMAQRLEEGHEPELVSHADWFDTQPMDVTSPESDFQRLWDQHERELKAARATRSA